MQVLPSWAGREVGAGSVRCPVSPSGSWSGAGLHWSSCNHGCHAVATRQDNINNNRSARKKILPAFPSLERRRWGCAAERYLPRASVSPLCCRPQPGPARCRAPGPPRCRPLPPARWVAAERWPARRESFPPAAAPRVPAQPAGKSCRPRRGPVPRTAARRRTKPLLWQRDIRAGETRSPARGQIPGAGSARRTSALRRGGACPRRRPRRRGPPAPPRRAAPRHELGAGGERGGDVPLRARLRSATRLWFGPRRTARGGRGRCAEQGAVPALSPRR